MSNWTEDRVGALKKLWLEGQSASQIAKALGAGTTRNAVIAKVHRLGLSNRAASPSPPPRATFRSAQSPKRQAHSQHHTRVGRKRTSIPLPEPSPEASTPGTATLMTLGSHMCKWPIGDPATQSFNFCGRRTSETYCAAHARIAYQPQVRKGGDVDLARSLRRYI